MQSMLKKCCGIMLIVAAAASDIASAANAGQDLNVCASYDRSVRTIAIDVSNLCTSSNVKYLGHDLKIAVVPNTAILKMTGSLSYRPSSSGIETADCMNQQTIHFELPDAEPRRYIFMDNGKRRGIFDFTKHDDRRCIKPRQSPVGYGWPVTSPNDPARKLVRQKLPELNGQSIQDILKPLMHELTMSGEGRDTLKLSIETVDQIGQTGKPGAVATITAYGLADDSVSGLRYAIDFIKQPGGWLAYGMAEYRMCGRGPDAGLWTSKPCP